MSRGIEESEHSSSSFTIAVDDHAPSTSPLSAAPDAAKNKHLIAPSKGPKYSEVQPVANCRATVKIINDPVIRTGETMQDIVRKLPWAYVKHCPPGHPKPSNRDKRGLESNSGFLTIGGVWQMRPIYIHSVLEDSAVLSQDEHGL